MQKDPFFLLSHFSFPTHLFKWSNITDPGTLRDTKICNCFEEVCSLSRRWSGLLNRPAVEGLLDGSGAQPWRGCRRLAERSVTVPPPLTQTHFPVFRPASLMCGTAALQYSADRRTVEPSNKILFCHSSYKAFPHSAISSQCPVNVCARVYVWVWNNMKVCFSGKQHIMVECESFLWGGGLAFSLPHLSQVTPFYMSGEQYSALRQTADLLTQWLTPRKYSTHAGPFHQHPPASQGEFSRKQRSSENKRYSVTILVLKSS